MSLSAGICPDSHGSGGLGWRQPGLPYPKWATKTSNQLTNKDENMRKFPIREIMEVLEVVVTVLKKVLKMRG